MRQSTYLVSLASSHHGFWTLNESRFWLYQHVLLTPTLNASVSKVGQQNNALGGKTITCWGTSRARRARLPLPPPLQQSSLNLPWPPLAKPLHPKGSWMHLVARCAPPHPAFPGSIHKSPATCADGLFTANKCLSELLLSDPVLRQGGDRPSFQWHKINEVPSSPNQRSWQASCPSPLSLSQAAPGWWSQPGLPLDTRWHERRWVSIPHPHRTNTTVGYPSPFHFWPGSIFLSSVPYLLVYLNSSWCWEKDGM